MKLLRNEDIKISFPVEFQKTAYSGEEHGNLNRNPLV
jgi:hypothetical protein